MNLNYLNKLTDQGGDKPSPYPVRNADMVAQVRTCVKIRRELS